MLWLRHPAFYFESGLSILSRGVPTTFGASFGWTPLRMKSLVSHLYTTIRDKLLIFQSACSTFIFGQKIVTGLLGIVGDNDIGL
jgi:hypothetical protein